MTDYRKNADQCYELAKQMANKPEHLQAFLEMAQTWEKLADLHELSQRLTLSGVLLKKPAVRAE
jgi:ferric-dicitrate binding protein FerR (iron transport regulator)